MFQMGNKSLIIHPVYMCPKAQRTLQGYYYYNCFVITIVTLALVMVNLFQ